MYILGYICILSYQQLDIPVLNSKSSNTYLHRNNDNAYVIASDFAWVCLHPMKTKGKDHNALSMSFFQREDIPTSMVVVDGSDKHILVKFCSKLFSREQ